MPFDVHVNEISKKVMGTLMYTTRISSLKKKKKKKKTNHRRPVPCSQHSKLLHSNMGYNKHRFTRYCAKTATFCSYGKRGQEILRSCLPHVKRATVAESETEAPL